MSNANTTDKIKWFAWAALCLALDFFLCIFFKWDAPSWALIASYAAYGIILVWFSYAVINDTDGQLAPGILILVIPTAAIACALLIEKYRIK